MKKNIAVIAALFIFVSCKSIDPLFRTEPAQSPEPVLYTLSLLAAGDNLIHKSMLDSSIEDGAYNFFPVYSELKDLIGQADIAFINQETVMGGAGFGYSGYPRFNTPSVMAVTLAELGFSVINHANNHAMDMGEAGVLATLDTWDAIPGIHYLGIRRSKDEPPPVVTRNNISLGFLSYTYGTNGLSLPKEKPWMVSLINRETMAAEIEALRPLCDFLIVSLHWGNEYTREPAASQISLANFLAEHGVDLVIGHHPHVIQRAEYINRPDGKQMLCFYSLGNFASNQEKKETLLGALAYVVFNKKGDTTFMGDAGIIPVVTHIEPGYVKTKVFPLYAYNNELMKNHRLYNKDDDFNRDYYTAYLDTLNTKLFPENPFSGAHNDRP